MRMSTFEQPLPLERAGRAAVGFRDNGRSYTGGWHVYPEMAAAGLWSTPADLCRFAIEVANAARGVSNRVLERSMAELMIDAPPGRHGLGLLSAGEWFEHAGANAGYRAHLWCKKDGSAGAVVMTNSDTGAKLIGAIRFALAKEYGWSNGS